MEDIHRKAIRKSWTTLINSITNEQTSHMMDYLVENEVLTMGMREEIEYERKTSDRNRKLFGLIPKRGPRAFQTLVDALLQNGLNHIVEKLLSNVIETPPVPDTTAILPTDTTPSDNTTECNICMTYTISVALTPCGHTLCSSCGDRIVRQGECCFCKQSVTNVQRIYF